MAALLLGIKFGTVILENCLSVLAQGEQMHNLQPRNSIPSLAKHAHACSPRDMYKNAHSTAISNSEKKTRNDPNGVHLLYSISGILQSNPKKHLQLLTATWTNLGRHTIEEKKHYTQMNTYGIIVYLKKKIKTRKTNLLEVRVQYLEVEMRVASQIPPCSMS